MLRFENYCAQPVELGADGLPVHNAHGGYDLQGVQAAAQRHDGTMTLHWADGWFTRGSCCRSRKSKGTPSVTSGDSSPQREAACGERNIVLFAKGPPLFEVRGRVSGWGNFCFWHDAQ